MVAMELSRVDSSMATFWGVHTGISAGSIYLCGNEEQKKRWLPAADAEAIYSYEGTREMNTLIVGKHITGLSAFV